MLPVVFLPDTPVLLAGLGPALARREILLRGAGLTALTICQGPPDLVLLDGMRLAFGAGLDAPDSAALAAAARTRAIPVNIEDVPALCDFHVPALVRRGDLLLTVSTGGTAPGLSSLLREHLEHLFGDDWCDHITRLAALRAELRASGAPPPTIRAALADNLTTVLDNAPGPTPSSVR